MIKAIIFDCFGVIYSSGFKTFLNNTVPAPQRAAAAELFAAYDRGLMDQTSLLDQVSELIDRPKELIVTAVFTGYKLDRSVLEYISELHGSYKTSMLSNLGEMTFQQIKGAIMDCFDDFVLSYNTGISKPDHRAFVLAAERLRVAPGECIFIDDDPENCEAAAATAMKAIVFTDINALRHELGLLLADADDEAPLGTD